MTAKAWHSTWTRMRRAVAKRRWLTSGELVTAVMERGVGVSRWRVQQIVRAMPRPPFRYGMYQFDRRHVAAVVAVIKERNQGGNHDRGGRAAATTPG